MQWTGPCSRKAKMALLEASAWPAARQELRVDSDIGALMPGMDFTSKKVPALMASSRTGMVS